MPKQGGLETIREFRNRFPEVSIIAMSGRALAVTMLSIAQNLEPLRFFTSHLLPTNWWPPWRKRWEENHQPSEARAAAALEHDDVTNPSDPCVKQVALGHFQRSHFSG